MIFSLQNEYLSVRIDSKGAELQSLVVIKTGVNQMWAGDNAFWGKFSPVLFPIVGALKDDTYHYQGQTYNLPRHGFARDLDFECVASNEAEISFRLIYSTATLKNYPFKFQLTISYRLEADSLICTYEVGNVDDKTMLFSIGGHPAFAVPVNHEIAYTDYFLKFSADDHLTYHHIVDNLIADETTTIALKDGILPLSHELFYQDALVFKHLKSKKIRLLNSKNESGLAFHFEGFPYFGIWAAKDADFVCLEPWCGIADGVNHSQQLEEKEGMETLEAGCFWTRSWRVSAS